MRSVCLPGRPTSDGVLADRLEEVIDEVAGKLGDLYRALSHGHDSVLDDDAYLRTSRVRNELARIIGVCEQPGLVPAFKAFRGWDAGGLGEDGGDGWICHGHVPRSRAFRLGLDLPGHDDELRDIVRSEQPLGRIRALDVEHRWVVFVGTGDDEVAWHLADVDRFDWRAEPVTVVLW